jgi:hypothetical protein
MIVRVLLRTLPLFAASFTPETARQHPRYHSRLLLRAACCCSLLLSAAALLPLLPLLRAAEACLACYQEHTHAPRKK